MAKILRLLSQSCDSYLRAATALNVTLPLPCVSLGGLGVMGLAEVAVGHLRPNRQAPGKIGTTKSTKEIRHFSLIAGSIGQSNPAAR
jgi:hypothetical protein